MHEVLVNRLGGLSLPRKSVVRLTDRPDMTLDVYRGRKTTMQQQQQNLGGAVHYWAILAVTPTGILSFVALLPYKYDGKGKKGLGLQGQKPLGQCYLGSAVHYWAILAVTPTEILSFVALLTNKYNGKG